MAFLTYKKPGAYSRYINDPNLVKTSGLFRVPAIIGPGRDTITISNQIIVRGYTRQLALLEQANAGDSQIKLTTTKHDLIPSDIIRICNADGTNSEDAVVVALDPVNPNYILVDTDLDTLGDQPLQKTHTVALTVVKEISMKDKVIPATDLVYPANITGLDKNLNPIPNMLVLADCIVAVGFAPFLRNYRANIDYDSHLVMDPDGSWYIKWLKAAYVIHDNLAKNGRANDITSGTAVKFYLGHTGLTDSDGVVDPNDPTYAAVKASIVLEIYDPITKTYSVAPYTITSVDPAFGVIVLNTAPTATVLQNGLLATYYYGNSKPSLGDTYYVSYDVQKSDVSYLPALYTDPAQVSNDFGSANLDNPISLAAFLCFSAGTDRIMMVQTKKTGYNVDGSTYSSTLDYEIAITALEAEEISVITTLSTDAVVTSYVFNHCVKMSSILNRKERFCIVTLDDSMFNRKQDEIQGFVDIANGYEQTGSGERIVVLAPAKIQLPTQDAATGVLSYSTVPSYYAAASIMGGLIQRDPAEPLTKKSVVGFSALEGKFKYTEPDKDTLGGNGVTVLEQNGTVISVRHGMTTDTTTPYSNEISVVQIKDYVAKILRNGLENAYVGRKLVPETLVGMKASTDAILGRLKVNEIIYGYRNINVVEDPYDPTQVNVTFDMKPISPLNYIMITITLNSRIGA